MGTELQKFDFNGHEFRVIERDGDPWFVAKDVTAVLGLSNVTMALKHLDADEQDRLPRSTFTSVEGGSDLPVVNEPGLYSLILRSRKERAREFKRWVTHVVLPTIRKHGGYVEPERVDPADPANLARLLEASTQALQVYAAKNAELTPRAVAATAQENLKDGQTVWDLKYAVSEALGTDPQQVHKVLGMIGAYEHRDGNYFTIRTRWNDLLFATPTVVGGKEYHNGAPRVRPGKQAEFLGRVKEQFYFRFGSAA